MTQRFDEPGTEARSNHKNDLINALCKLQHRGLERVLSAQEEIPAEEVTETFFSFAMGSHHFVVNAQCFCEVFVDIAIATLPNSPQCLRGLCNVRGLLLPVYQLHGFLGEIPAKKTVIFCIGKGDKSVGLLIDALPTSLALRRSDRTKLDSSIRLVSELTNTDYFSAGKTWHLLDGNRLGEQLLSLSAAEQQYFITAQPQDISVFR